MHACVGSCVHNCTCMWRPEVDARNHLLCSSTILIGQSRAFWYFNQLAVRDPLSLYLHGLQLQTGHHAYLAIVSGYLNSAPHFVNLPLSHLPSPYIDFDSTTGSSYDQCFIRSCECEVETNLWSDWVDPVGSRWSLKFHLSNNLGDDAKGAGPQVTVSLLRVYIIVVPRLMTSPNTPVLLLPSCLQAFLIFPAVFNSRSRVWISLSNPVFCLRAGPLSGYMNCSRSHGPSADPGLSCNSSVLVGIHTK